MAAQRAQDDDDLDEEFHLLLRSGPGPGPSGISQVPSDATAALDHGTAADALDALDVEVPDLDLDELDDTEPWAEGDLGRLDDLWLSEPALGIRSFSARRTPTPMSSWR